jgi:DNA-binding transcriptional ArsR family regulator
LSNAARFVIRKDQLAALASAGRQEILDVLAEMGTVSVAELAAALGRPPDALYFHLRALTRVGLVRQAGHRGTGRRTEALFRTVARELWLDYTPRTPSHHRRIAAIVRSMLRIGIRDFDRALATSGVSVSGGHRELWALRTTGRLSLPQVARVNRAIATLKRSVSSRGRRGRFYAVTILLTPLDRRRTRAPVRPKGPRRR